MTQKTPKSAGHKTHADKSKPDGKPGAARAGASDGKTPPGDRIAKVLARAGIASRRDAEAMITEGRVTVNGRKVLSPALNVLPKDRITVDGQEVGEPEPPRLWLYHKPTGLVTTARDEKGRETVFENLPAELPRVMSVGRLDLNSEGLLLLTNDGEIKRRLELPDTGWLRKYRVRVKGTASEQTLEPLRKGISIDGENFQPMEVVFDRQQGANAWLTVGIREGKNREIRRAMEHIGLTVNRLLRISYGPFRLGTLKPGEVEEVRPRVFRDQLGLDKAESGDDSGFAKPKRQVSRGGKPGGPRTETTGRDPRGPKPPFKKHGSGRDGGPRGDRFGDDRGRSGAPKGDGFKKRDDRQSDRQGGFEKRDGGRGGERREGGKPGFKSKGFKSHGGGKDGKPRSAGFKSHGGGKDGKPRSAGFKSHGGGSKGGSGGGRGGDNRGGKSHGPRGGGERGSGGGYRGKPGGKRRD